MREHIALHVGPDAVGAELGVATGQFSKRLLDTGRFARLYSIDAWADRRHSTDEMRRAMALLAPYGDQSVVLRQWFHHAVRNFSDGYFDFIYIDGYADTGEEDGATLEDWWPKLKRGGLFAGDDYDPRWPLVVQSVDRFAAHHGRTVMLHCFNTEGENVWGRSPSWYIVK